MPKKPKLPYGQSAIAEGLPPPQRHQGPTTMDELQRERAAHLERVRREREKAAEEAKKH